MTLTAGSQLGPYEVVSAIGAGGMGEVYRARDTRLGREVAVKILPEDVALDQARLRRFEQEARTASALNHPNILSVFDVGASIGIEYLVTELVEGTTLRDRLAGGALSSREVVHIGAQIADGLAAAHGAGLVHRDLKPDNLMVTRDGRVKILDFGLAKPVSTGVPAAQTRTVLSHPGLIVGTLGYVSPEHVRGEEVDGRADLFSLGVVLHEMAAGERAFDRQTTVETLNAILKEDAPELPATIPAGLRHIIAHCLEKDPARRFQTAQDVAFALRSLATTTTAQAIPPQLRSPGRAMRWVGVSVAALALLGIGAGLSWFSATPPVDLSGIRFVPFAVDEEYEEQGAWAPDGKSLAYIRHTGDGGSQIVLRAEDSSSISVLAREATTGLADLFWAPDGSRVFYVEQRSGGGLKSVSAVGGAPRMDVPGAMAAHLSPDGHLVAIWKATEAEGRTEAALWIGPLNGTLARYEPAPVVIEGAFNPNVIKFSPDGRRILVSVTGGPPALLIVPTPRTGAAGGPAQRVFDGRMDGLPAGAAWMPDSRRVVVPGNDSLWLGDISSGRLTRLTLGMLQPQAPSVAPSGDRLIFTDVRDDYDIVTLRLDGSAPRVVVGTSQYEGAPAWAPRGGRLAYVAARGDGEEIWTRGDEELSDRRLLGARQMPDPQYRIFKSLAFSPDGQWLAFMGAARTPELKARIWVMPAGGGTPRGVTPDEMLALRAGWSPDGRSLLVFMNDRGTHGLWIVDPAGEQAPRRIPLPGGLDARMPEWSPAGDWIAAIEWAPGGQPRPTLLIRPDTGEIRRLPALDSAALVWAADGRTLYGVQNRAGTARLQAIDVAGGALRTVADYGVPLNLIEDLGAVVRYSLTPDGSAFTTTRLTSRADLWMITGLPR